MLQWLYFARNVVALNVFILVLLHECVTRPLAQGLVLRRASSLVQGTAATILKLLILTLGPPSYVAPPK